MTFRVLCFLTTLLAACGSLFAQTKPVHGQWNKCQTKHFSVIGNAETARLRGVSTRLEQFRSAVHKALGLSQQATVETRVVIFRDTASFRPFKPKRLDGTPDDLVSGLFQSGNDVNYISAADDGAEIATVFHEYIHDVLARNFPGTEIPSWLNEGLAEYFQGFRTLDGRTIEFGLPHRSHIAILRRRPLIPWNKFFALDDVTLQQSSNEDRLVFYAQAWVLVHDLIGTSDSGQVSMSGLNRSATELSAESLNARFVNVLSASALPSRPLSISPETSHVIPKLSSLSEPEINAYLGDLAYRMRDLSMAENYLDAALANAPKLALANSSLGLIRLTQRRFAEAKTLFDTALQADESNFLVYFYSAFLISREFTDEVGTISKFPLEAAAKMRTLLNRAIALNPEHCESYKLLAFVSLVSGDETNAALGSIKKAIVIEPGNQEYRLIAAQLLLRLERPQEAASAATHILTSTRDRYLLSEAEQVVRSADAFLAARSEADVLKVNIGNAGFAKPIFLQRKDLTDGDVARIELNRDINNLNRLIERAGPTERQDVGRIERLGCSNNGVSYRFRGESGTVRLIGKGFDDLHVKVLLNGTHSFTFRCDASLEKVLAVVIYRPFENANGGDGMLLSVAFVPEYFRLKTLDDLSLERQIIIEGMRPSDLAANAKAAEAEQKDLEREMRETQIRNIEMRLRQPEPAERRVIAVPENLTCSDGRFVLTATSGEKQMIFSVPIGKRFELYSFASEAGILELGCRSLLPPVNAVITYRPDSANAGRNELIAVEFVPKIFKLP